MSAWAYRKCEKCGKEVHINHICREWGSGDCDGDPWQEKEKTDQKIHELNEERAKLTSDIVNIDRDLERLKKKKMKQLGNLKNA